MKVLSYEERKDALIKKQKEREQIETLEFLNKVDVLQDFRDNLINPIVLIKRKTKDNYIEYSITKYPNCLMYSVVMYRNYYPFSIYYEKNYFKNEIPKKHNKEFQELEKLFIN